MTDTISSPGIQSQETKSSQGNFLVNNVFGGKDFGKLVEAFHIDEYEVKWDVGVPMLGDRPVLDDSLVREGKTSEKRIHLGIASTPKHDELVISLTNLRNSASDDEVVLFKPPLIEGVEHGVFAANTTHEEFDGMVAALKTDGSLTLAGLHEGQKPVVLFLGTNLANRDYERGVNFFERMLRVPLLHGVQRRPIE